MAVVPQSPARLLLVDDDPAMSLLLQQLVDSPQTEIVAARSLKHGLQLAGQSRFDVVLLDHRLPDGEGISILSTLIEQDRLRPVLYITAQIGAETAIEAIKGGAFDYLSKPVDFALLRRRLAEALEYRTLVQTPVLLGDSLSQAGSEMLVGRCRGMQEVYKSIGRLSSLESPVLIEGEPGTGKELVARSIHQHSPRGGEPFVKLHAAELTEESFQAAVFAALNLEGEHDPTSKPSSGTLMIEDLAQFTPGLQSRLVRWLREHGERPQAAARRLVLSTSTSLRRLVESGRLRSDLFYALSPYMVHLPPLRERREDFELLVSHFMHRLASVSAIGGQAAPPRVSASAMALIRGYDWPGNVAQLKSVLQSVLMESRGTVLATEALRSALESPSIADNDPERTAATLGASRSTWQLDQFFQSRLACESHQVYDEAIAELDQKLMPLVLRHTQGNQAAAARMLGMTRTSLRRKIQAARIDLSQFGAPSSWVESDEDGAISTFEQT